MISYSALTKAIEQQAQERENALPLMDEDSRSRFFFHPSPTTKVCLFFHGFTATPAQFLPMGEMFFQAGYNVLIPLLPGHGIAGIWDRHSPPPLPEEQQVYQQFGLEWLQIAHQFGSQVITGGLSGGSTLAAWLALESPEQIYRSLVFAPYLSSTNKLVDLIVQLTDIYFEWKTKPGRISFGYNGFHMPALRLFLDMGAEVLERAKTTLAAPMLIMSSGSDQAVGIHEHQALFAAVSKFQPLSWYYCFDRAFDIPHNMMTRGEGNEHLDLLLAIAKAYVESDLTWTEVEEIVSQMRQGNAFNQVVERLHLGQRVVPELSRMVVTMI